MTKKLLEIIFLYTFLSAIGIIIYCVKTKKSEAATKHIIWIAFIPMYLMFIYIPFWYANILLGNNGATILMMIMFLGYLIIRIGIVIYNRMKVNLSKDEGIYVRDVEVEYSPAVLSYLQNQKIEEKKDIVACILNLCAKGFLKIEKKKENYYELNPLPNKDSETLKKDEKYLYSTICKKEKLDMNIWMKYIKEEFESYHFTKKDKIRIDLIFLYSYFIMMIVFLIYLQVSGGNQNYSGILGTMFILLFVGMELSLLEPPIRAIIRYLRKGEYLDGTYTTKGAKEMKRWDKYKKFLEDYTLLENKPLESVIVLEKHLAYATVLNVNTSYTKSFIEQFEVTYKINLDYINNMLKEINKGA